MKIRRVPFLTEPARASDSACVPMEAIQRFAREVAERFRPDKIILFGSYAYGRPQPDSDVDILVVTSARNEHDQAVKIRMAVPVSFPMDLLVRSPSDLRWRLAEGDSFVEEIVSKGKVLYEKTDLRMGAKGRGRPDRSKANSSQRSPRT